MAAHDAPGPGAAVCSQAARRCSAPLSPAEIGRLPAPGRRAAGGAQRFVLCPYCQQHRAQVWGDGRGSAPAIPECGPVSVAPTMAALGLDEDWLMTEAAPRTGDREPRWRRRSRRWRVAAG